jgi:hypothetical protein
LAGDIKRTLITIGSFLAVVLISYVMADGLETEMRDGDILSASGSRWVSTGLYMFYILGVLAIGAMFSGGLKKLISK